MTAMELVETIERLTHERDEARRMAAAREQAGANARLTERLVREDLARERESNAAHAAEHSRAIVAGIAGAMGLDTSGEGDAIHARILAEHARLTRERDEARAIIEGRTVAPTDAEIVAHWRAGGTWIVEGIIVLRVVEAVCAHRDQASWAAVTWLPLDRSRRPCAWPTVTP